VIRLMFIGVTRVVRALRVTRVVKAIIVIGSCYL
jgi:hypothetical protein